MNPPADYIDDRKLMAWLDQQPAAWLAGQLKELMGYDDNLRNHLWQCLCNTPDQWSGEEALYRFRLIAKPGEFRDESIEMDEIAKIERFLAQLAPLAERRPPLPDFSQTMEQIIEIMQPMFADWGEGWYWDRVLIQAMSIHAAACRHDPAGHVRLQRWLDGRIRDPSWPLEVKWVREAYGDLSPA